ncbi:hypothetical protein [Rhizomonospora bruguierae]|uniref:hypothetical protein n=1 Tax=Rhizomonospora bruguierae TaxID=1581705 RepID=UPI001BD194F8|nr:hypothetical protein [Micromonospora sp. NBRC 107566]
MNIRFGRVLLVTALLVAGCSSTDNSGSAKSYDEAMKEYQAATAKLTLPPGAADWPGLKSQQDGASVTYQPDAATGMAQSYWQCAWEKEWLAQRGRDTARETKALEQLATYPDMVSYAKLDETGQRFFQEFMAKAKLGDPSGFQQDVRANCE